MTGCQAQRHGTYSAYRQGCRCPEAREDWRLYNKRHREHRAAPRVIDATGTHRRIRALHALGWTGEHIAAAAGLHYRRPGNVLLRGRVTTTTAAAISRAYDTLSMRPGPSVKTRKLAATRGWLPPLAWDDDDLDNPAAAPHTPPASGWDLRPCGTRAAHRRHLRRGEPIDEACRLANARREDAA